MVGMVAVAAAADMSEPTSAAEPRHPRAPRAVARDISITKPFNRANRRHAIRGTVVKRVPMSVRKGVRRWTQKF